LTRRAATALLALAVAASRCGGGGSSPAGPNPPANTHRITIGANGVVSPTELTVPPGTRVLFTNNHGAAHDMTSDPHPEHNLCPELNQVGLLRPGEFRETGNLVTVRTCGFHDHNDPDNRNLQGSIAIR
jgi:plastocyanin